MGSSRLCLRFNSKDSSSFRKIRSERPDEEVDTKTERLKLHGILQGIAQDRTISQRIAHIYCTFYFNFYSTNNTCPGFPTANRQSLPIDNRISRRLISR